MPSAPHQLGWLDQGQCWHLLSEQLFWRFRQVPEEHRDYWTCGDRGSDWMPSFLQPQQEQKTWHCCHQMVHRGWFQQQLLQLQQVCWKGAGGSGRLHAAVEM